ncbi:DJ-1/PfpI family protein [Pusillimonas sp. SM2304]|uniref:DJ-1/PfpI family protein n=1 Tax=Pusillimonas sp. SM2304 TaxID=3073241 RepID=UPI002876D634|nr:DJ-1/PfpI family protein [Pusillimonas sp. SM2304]MDS1141413.1 DJ-1/PfpI family protein [Pusillimonas sp. SM2304]
MRKKWMLIALGCIVAVPLLAAPFILAPGKQPPNAPLADPIESAEQARMIEAMKPPHGKRPVVAIVALNASTEVSDFMVAYGVLHLADVADVTVVAERAEPVQLYPPDLSIEPETTLDAFDAQYPGGADYIVIPAMEPHDDPVIIDWITGQLGKGARIVSICNGSRTLAAAGLLDGRRATGHWYTIGELLKKHPTMQWVRDRRYVTDQGITTSTGVSANVPVMLALVEAIGGRQTAERVAGELGIAAWDGRHRSAAFQLTTEHKKTFVRNTLAFWRHETLGIPLVQGVDEIALGLTADAYSRTALAKVITLGVSREPLRSRHGLVIHPTQAARAAAVDHMLAAPSSSAPAAVLERELPHIASRYDRPTAAIVALTMEYPWLASPSGLASPP